VLPATPAEAAERVADKIDTPAETVERTLTARMKELLDRDNTSTQLAIDENRTRMAFNIALLEFYAENPALLANVRDSAALPRRDHDRGQAVGRRLDRHHAAAGRRPAGGRRQPGRSPDEDGRRWKSTRPRRQVQRLPGAAARWSRSLRGLATSPIQSSGR
jgi:hypothetical protein